MTIGSSTYDASGGAELFQSNFGSVGKVLGTVTLSSAGGSITDGRLTAGQPFAMPNFLAAGQYQNPFTFSGNTMSWPAANNGSQARSGTWYYGVGPATNPNYVSTHVPGTAGFRINDEQGRFVIDETFFALQLINKLSVNVPSQTYPVDIPYPRTAMPLMAVRSPGYCTLLSVQDHPTTPGWTRVIFTFRNFFSATFYFFAQVDGSKTKGYGERWFSPAGVLMGDTSIPFLRTISANVPFNQWTPNFELQIGGTVANRKYAMLINAPGFYVVSSGSGGQTGGSVATYVAAPRVVTTSNPEQVYVGCIQTSASNAGGESGSINSGPAAYSLIDVTGYE